MKLPFEREQYAGYAVPAKKLEGEMWRPAHKHDIDEVVYSHSFRKLAQKTQVIVRPNKDVFRNRLTHTLEVAQIADNFGQFFDLNRDLIHAIALSHDLGHPPFAHVGERTLARLLKDYFRRALKPLGENHRPRMSDIDLFEFRHSENSRRILQRKTKRLDDLTLISVVGHGWSPWSGASRRSSLDAVEEQLNKSLEHSACLPCFEAQAVSLSDQIAGVNSDIEDLLTLFGDAKPIVKKVEELLERSDLSAGDVKEIRSTIEKFIPRGAKKPRDGRKHRIGTTVEEVCKSSTKYAEACANYQESLTSPLRTSPIFAVALDTIEMATRLIVWSHPHIRTRDLLAESAVSQLYNRLLTHITSQGDDRTERSGLPTVIVDDFAHWREDYAREARHEHAHGKLFSYPTMKETCENVSQNLWHQVEPALTVVDYISELTDRFVIDEAFRDDPFQKVLRAEFLSKEDLGGI